MRLGSDINMPRVPITVAVELVTMLAPIAELPGMLVDDLSMNMVTHFGQEVRAAVAALGRGSIELAVAECSRLASLVVCLDELNLLIPPHGDIVHLARELVDADEYPEIAMRRALQKMRTGGAA
jgi:hypothetical protein